MKDYYIMVLEVSQKQAYIFNEKRLANNVIASDTIAYVTSSEFFKEKFSKDYNEDENLIYAGGGHTLLVFPGEEKAKTFAKHISKYVLEELSGLELFIKTMKYDVNKTPGSNIGDLLNELERKKSLRRASFYQKSFGLEKSGGIASVSGGDEYRNDSLEENRKSISRKVQKNSANDPFDVNSCPQGYLFPSKFQDMGGIKDKNNFIAVIHIDGNQMGARVQDLDKYVIQKKIEDQVGILEEKDRAFYSKESFEIWREESRRFSESIDKDFKHALVAVYNDIRDSLENSKSALKGLDLKKKGEKTYFPLRKIIAAGDDICFVTEGRIGLECAVRFIKHLESESIRNEADGKGYHACAGVAIVHQKYPFYRAYELAEELCSNAKKKMAERIDNYNSKKENKNKPMADGSLSAIDWHIEYGELLGDVDDIRDHQVDFDGKELYERPYQITVSPFETQPLNYDSFVKLLRTIKEGEKGNTALFDDNIARNKSKALRSQLKKGQTSFKKYCAFNMIPSALYEYNSPGEIFDALEVMDVYLPLNKED